jgi:hypothetical protein
LPVSELSVSELPISELHLSELYGHNNLEWLRLTKRKVVYDSCLLTEQTLFLSTKNMF